MNADPIPLGLATRAGLAGAVAAFAGAVVATVQGLTPEALASVVTAGLTLLAVLGGRYAQAAAAIRSTAGTVRDAAAVISSHELPEGPDPDPVDAELDHGKILVDDLDELGLDRSLLRPDAPEALPSDHDDGASR